MAGSNGVEFRRRESGGSARHLLKFRGRDLVLVVGAALLAGMSLVAFGLYLARVWDFTVDDAFITFRYSKMLATGHGPTYNAGLPHAEGYTSFLWMAYLAVPHVLGVSPVAFAKVSGVVLLVIAMGLASWIVDCYSRDSPLGLRVLADAFPIVLLTLFVPTAIHAVAGMETALYTCLVTAFLASLALWRRLHGAAPWIVATLALLTGLTRPEGNLVVVVGLVTLLAVDRTRRKQLLFAVAAVYVLPGVAYFAWRLSYYGHVFPLPYYIKLGNQQHLAGRADVQHFVRLLLPLVPLAGLGLFLGGFRRLVAPSAAALAVPLFFLFPSHIQGYEWRFDYPVIPFAAALAAIGVARTIEILAVSEKPRLARWIVVVAAVLLVALTLRNTTQATRAQLRLYSWDASGPNRVREDLGRFLSRHASSSSVMAMGDSGAAPYYAGWTNIDTYGLNDAHIATSGYYATGRLDTKYVFSLHPALIVITNEGQRIFAPEYDRDRALLAAARRHGMRLIRSVRVNRAYYYWLIARPHTALAEALDVWRPPVILPRPTPAGDNPVLGALSLHRHADVG